MDYTLPHEWLSYVGSLHATLAPLLSETRRERLNRVLAQRSRSVLCVFESTHHSHNISAVLRTIEAMGYCEAVFVYTDPLMRFRARDSVERGAAQWLLTRRTSSVHDTGRALRQAGYRVVLVSRPDFALTASSYDQALPNFSVDEPKSLWNGQEPPPNQRIALIFGSELHGVHADWLSSADGYLSVGMHGFIESLNLSVCAGILLHSLRQHAAEPLSCFERSLMGDYWLARSTASARRTVVAHNKALEPYFDFLCAGKFFNLPKPSTTPN